MEGVFLLSYVSMKEMINDAKDKGYAIGAFNIVDYITAVSVIKAAEIKNSPVIIQTSTKTVSLYGYSAIVGWVKTLAAESKVPVALHLDHCKDLNIIKNCIDAGWSSVMIDASSYSLDENIHMTQQVVEMTRGKDITVEGELGAIVGVEDDIFVSEHDEHLADPQTCIKYVNATGIDILAPAIGTAHGIYHKDPNISFKLIEEIATSTGMPLAIHGGTGLSEDVFKKCILSGGAKINISTSIKHTFRDSLEGYYKAHPGDYEPVKAIGFLKENVMKLVADFIDIFGSANKA